MSSEAAAIPTRPRTILVVDDEDAIRRFVARAIGLGDDGTIVVEAQDGRSALEAFAGDPERFDLLVCDLTLPDVAGADVVKEVRAARPGLPVVVVTGWDPASAEESLGRAGPVAFLQKPFSLADLQVALRKALPAA